ncbi:glycosyltransferase 61 family protein [Acetobacter sicerae]|uniref:Glycosyltransferase 61 family protein n=1 Tax=Acetobacter sicerae TaxID=85325 RepID=A0ABS8VWT9_9PROT|nr:glycosyltransferase 61 family protein [Acetobacter sicerae]MCE0745185.1 glycosyltransferase 61 family protein [Acetobacter sicerae]
MSSICKTNTVYGETVILDSEPALLDLCDVVYVPELDSNSSSGIFDQGRKRILQSAYFRGPNPEEVAPPLIMGYRYGDINEYAPDEVYIYCGFIHSHFGHFLLSTFSRFWSAARERFPHAKILYSSHQSMEFWFGDNSFMPKLFGALNLSLDDFVCFSSPRKIRRLILPAPAFEEANFAYRRYATFCHEVGRKLAGALMDKPDLRPVYLSKSKLQSGVRRLINEDVICDRLEANGVEIVYPETLSLEEQIALWANRPYVTGFVGSAFHTSIFVPRDHVFMINYNMTTYSNFCLIDQVNNAQADYYGIPQGGMTILDPEKNPEQTQGFTEVCMAADPIGIADGILRIFDYKIRADSSRAHKRVVLGAFQWQKQGAENEADAAALRNVAIDKKTRQSSLHPWIPDQTINATSGTLTGTFQFHTDTEKNPWWEVDLDEPCRIKSIRLFNRCDSAPERCNRLRIEVGMDENSLKIVLEKQDARVIGGVDGMPLEWQASEPLVGRVIRITSLADDYFHLDQVEVLGWSASETENSVENTN